MIKGDQQTKHIKGSSTITIVTLDGDQLNVGHMGDSGFMLLRKVNETYSIIFESEVMQKGFNFPFQIGS